MHHRLLVFQFGKQQDIAGKICQFAGVVKYFLNIVVVLFRGEIVILQKGSVAFNRGDRCLKFMGYICDKITAQGFNV